MLSAVSLQGRSLAHSAGRLRSTAPANPCRRARRIGLVARDQPRRIRKYSHRRQRERVSCGPVMARISPTGCRGSRRPFATCPPRAPSDRRRSGRVLDGQSDLGSADAPKARRLADWPRRLRPRGPRLGEDLRQRPPGAAQSASAAASPCSPAADSAAVIFSRSLGGRGRAHAFAKACAPSSSSEAGSCRRARIGAYLCERNSRAAPS